MAGPSCRTAVNRSAVQEGPVNDLDDGTQSAGLVRPAAPGSHWWV